ncbi:hypothetical protein AB4X15_02860 [Peribacillus simplex]|uniref:hypothetical protein n=1 Tax=Peribacillus simplex TaxID=1478 RepID=UPI0034E84B50
MTEKELQAIRERADKATAGPWEVCNGTDVFTKLGADNNDGVTANHNDGWHIAKCNEGSTSVGDEEVELSFNEQNANAHFITKAREDVPKLLAEVSRLQGEVKRLKGVLEYISDEAESFYEVDYVDDTGIVMRVRKDLAQYRGTIQEIFTVSSQEVYGNGDE